MLRLCGKSFDSDSDSDTDSDSSSSDENLDGYH